MTTDQSRFRSILPILYNLNVISLKRGGKVILPSPNDPMMPDDVLYVIGDMKDIRKCFKI